MLCSDRSPPPYQIGRPLSRSLTTIRYVCPFRRDSSSMPIARGAATGLRRSCSSIYSFSNVFTACQSSFSSFATSVTVMARPFLPPHEVENPPCVKGFVSQPGELLAFHVPTPFALDPPNLHLQIDSAGPVQK